MTDPSELHGHWHLVSWTGTDADGREVSHGGAEPRGDLIYLPSGRMAVQIQHDSRPTFGSRDFAAGDTEGRAEAWATYNAYCGTWSLPREGVVVHHVEMALHPDQSGMDKERPFKLEGDVLSLETQPVRTAEGEASSVLRWRRDDS
jgi:hypothetical protein